MPGTALWVDAFVCLPGFTCLPLSPFICLPLSPSLDDPVWVDGFICLPLSFVSRCLPAWMPVSGWTGSFVSLCLPSFVSQPGCLARLGFICLPLSPVVSQPGCLGGQIHLSPLVSLHLSPVVSQPGSGTALWVDGFMCLPLSPSFVSRSLPAWMPGTALWVDGFICLPLSPLISPVVSQPGCLARLSGWTGSFVSLCLPSFVSRCLPAWMPGAALWVDGFICLPLSPQNVWHPFVSLHLSPVVSQPGCLSRLSRRTSPLVPLHLSPISVGGRIHLFPFVSLYLSPVVSQPGCLIHLSPVVSQPGCVALTLRASRGSVLLAGSGLPSALALASVIPCLVDVGTGSSSVCPSSGLRFRLGSWWVVFLVYRWLHPVCSFSASLSVAVPS